MLNVKRKINTNIRTSMMIQVSSNIRNGDLDSQWNIVCILNDSVQNRVTYNVKNPILVQANE